MRLSRLHIAGFKSFPDRAELGFDLGVTAIVGPNGCGKSNVVDAITWVLGEQSAKSLRGERMEDVIFNGSDARKPTATAEVRLKFTQVAQLPALPPPTAPELEGLLDETPLLMRDVEIGRRLYRSGESEYLIDGESCRLRDVHDLLMDSGLGVKAYAVIEQGKIGQILSSRPAERRMLIEEAAGVTKYKARRRSAELKLEAAQQNLTRVDDIVFEVEKQRAALQRQAARARRYRRLRDELRKWEQVQFSRRFTALTLDIASAEARLEATRVRETAAAAHVAELEAALSAERIALAEADAKATTAREQTHARELEIGRLQQQIASDRQQTAELGRQAEVFAAEALDLEARRAPATLELASQREAAARIRETLGHAAAEVDRREADYERVLAAVQAVQHEADETRAAVLSAGATLTALRQARDNAGNARDRVAAECERLQIELRDLTAEAERAQDQHAGISRQLASAREARDVLSDERRQAENELATRRADRETARAGHADSARALASREARLRSLEELDAQRATFGDAARLILGEEGAALRRHGAVADHLVVERSYERAVETLLGDLLQHVLVDTEADAEAGLSLLTNRGAGRCGFLVLSGATAPIHPEPPLVVPPGARPLETVVRATGPHAAVVNRVISRALIVDSLEAAESLARTVSAPVATAAGEVCRGGWLVQGGQGQGARGILETRAEVLSLRSEAAAASADVAERAASLADLERWIAESDAALVVTSGRLHDYEKSIVALEGQVAHAADDRTRVARRMDVVTTERARADAERQESEQRRAEATVAIETHEQAQRDADARLAGILARLQSARDEAESAMRLVTASRTEQATLSERVSGLDADVRRLDEAARELEARIASRRADITRTESRREELAAAIAESERRLDEGGVAIQALRSALRDLETEAASLRDQFNRRDQGIRAARHTLDEVRSDVMKSEVARARAAADLAHLGEACVEATGLALEQVATAVAEMQARGELVPPARRGAAASDGDTDENGEAVEPDESAQSDISATALAADGNDGITATSHAEAGASDVSPEAIVVDLRQKIDRLGPVNMMAIEQFDELETRHTFLTTQRKDLLDAIAQTGEAIKRIDTTTSERFAEAFESINRHFETTFTTLFGGGRAGLVLIDQENDVESGIDIIAQPPGKRLQNVQLLSGGEKAMTAMALMFAVFKHRPSPFCLLDEIDAPLDDANIGRFVEMLLGMQEHTQFILITHNRKTMEIANRLYGVTMEEPGVSKLISLQLN